MDVSSAQDTFVMYVYYIMTTTVLTNRVRTSTPTWTKNYKDAKVAISQNLFFCNPTIRKLVDLLYTFRATRILDFDGIVNRGSPFELRQFRSLVIQRIDKCTDRIMQSYYVFFILDGIRM